MYDPISVDTALVSANGDLLIQLTDGNIINAGKVRGSQGPQGERGLMGMKGDPGRDGVDGAQWHTGVGAPELALGENGDFYMDVAAAVLPIYQKVGGNWMFLANLKGGGGGGGVGATGNGAAGDGSAVIIKPGPTPPTNDNEGNPINIGDLWWDSTTGLIYINTINGWVAISDHPPIIVSPDPPDFTNNSDPTDANKRYAVREGDAWFDSDQAALYVAVKNVDDDLVWVISTPADRSILQDEIPVGGFIFPAATQDGDTVFNDTTGLWYVYNGAKKQWIDLPPGERELSYPGILREADPGIDETYEGEAGAADGDVYINASDHEAGTRLVVRKVDRKGFAWTDFIQGIAEGDGIALVQTNYDNGPDNPQTQRVDYLIVTSIVENPDSFSIEVDYEQQNFDHDPFFDEEVSVRFLAQVSSPAVCVTFQEATPEPKCVGHLWFDSSEDDYTLYLYDGNEWVPAAPPVSLEGIEQSIYHISEKLSVVETGVVGARVDIAGNAGEIEAAKVRLEDLETSQAVQDGQIIELEEEIESLAPSLDRGKWNLAQLGENVTLASGEYAMGIGANRVYCEEQYEQCLLAIGGNPNDDPAALAECNRIAGVCFNAADGNGEYYMNDWSHATFLHFHKTDSEGKTHTFSDYEVGMFIDLFDQGDTGFAVFEITAAPTLDGDVYTIGVTPVQHEGEASGLARIKVFKLASADPTDYVRKTGDRMSGRLQITAENTGDALIVKGNTEGNTSIFYVRNARDRTQFRVTGEGKVQAGEASSPFLASAKNDLTTKAYVDQAVHEALTRELTAPANLEWYVYTNTAAKPSAGKAHVSGTSMLNSNTIILSLRPNNSAYEFQAGPISGTTMYNNQGNYRSVVLSVWYFREFNGGGEWKWKGTCDVDRVKLYDTYIYIVMGPSNYRTGNGDFSSELRYRFTLSGFF